MPTYPSQPRQFFGVHSFTPYSRTDGTFYGAMKVLKGSSFSFQAELVESMGGANRYPWAVEEGKITAELSLKFAQFDDFVFTLFMGKAPTSTGAETTGAVSTLTNVYGSSIKNASNGISGVAATSSDESDLKFGKYLLKATAAGVATLYLASDVDIGRGNNAAYTSDLLAIETITVSSTSHVSSLTGLTFTKAGTPAFTTNDTAEFYVRPIAGSGGMTVDIGSIQDQSFPEFGALVYGQKRGTQELIEIEAFRCKAAGFPLNFEENAWAEAETKIKLFYDASKDKVFSIRFVTPSGT